jgi:hypothetical protein
MRCLFLFLFVTVFMKESELQQRMMVVANGIEHLHNMESFCIIPVTETDSIELFECANYTKK